MNSDVQWSHIEKGGGKLYKKQNTVVLSLYIFLLCRMLFSLISPQGGVFAALFDMMSYGVSMVLCTLFLSSYADDIKKDTRTLPKLPILCIIFALCVMYAGNVFSSALSEAFKGFGYGIDADFPIYSDVPSVIISFIHLVILPPLLEEILMRKLVLGSVLPFGKSGAVIFSSLIFALFHMNLMQIPFAFLCGLVFGYFTVKTGSLFFAVLLHFLKNLSSFILSLRDTFHLLQLGAEIDRLAEEGMFKGPIQDILQNDLGVFGIDEIFGLDIARLYGAIGQTNFGDIDVNKPGVVKRLNEAGKPGKPSCHTFLDDIVGAIAAAAATRVSQIISEENAAKGNN